MAETTALQLDQIIDWIDGAFGEEALPGDGFELEALREICSADAFQRYLRDQVNRQIIRDYLTNAVVLGVISEGGLAAFAPDIATEEGRAVLALYMLMSAVEDAGDLPLGNGEVVVLSPLAPEPEHKRPSIKLVPN